MSGPLQGTCVVDCSRGLAGPMCAGLLADYGADVIRVEPAGGDPFRPDAAARAVLDRGKRSLVLDLARAQGRDVLARLLARADVFLESWRPGVAESRGLGWEALHADHPRLIACSISAYGRSGPDRDRPGHEALVAARLGVMAEQVGFRDGPIFEAVPMANLGAALLALIGIQAALYQREADGQGQRVETSLADGALAFLTMFWQWAEVPTPAAGHVEPRRRLIAGALECAGGEYLGVHTGAVGAHRRAMEVLGLAGEIAPARGAAEMGEPLSEAEAELLARRLPEIFRSRSREEWERALLAADVCAIPVLRPGQVFDHPQVRHNGVIARVDDPELGRVEQVGIAARFERTPAALRGAAPRPGDNSDAILAEAGCSAAETDALRRAGVVGGGRATREGSA
jgi:crotonobetainyl-CoA:carnitine CoA-transferase CaiB-like acyl-CoA transferase